MQAARIPAGILDNSIEFFTVKGTAGLEPMYMQGGIRHDFEETPAAIRDLFLADMRTRGVEKRVEALAGSSCSDAKVKRYIMCRNGEFDCTPDITEAGQLSEPEFVPCAQRGSCTHEGKVCCHMTIGETVLSQAESTVMRVINLPIKVMAERLYLSEDTVKSHLKNIRAKTSLNDKVEMAIWATQRGIF